ncbi:MAG: hypothetical protein U0Z53_17750 [Blastocatellia bacterium]
MTEYPTREQFAENLHSTFRLQTTDARELSLELISLTLLPSAPQQEQYSLIFRGPADTLLSQGTYRLEHDRLGAFDLFLVPIARDQQGVQYEVIFNRLQ